MVEFCAHCKSSLPKADLTIRGGEIFCSHDYECPFCSQPANPPPAGDRREEIMPDDQNDLVIRGGSVAREAAGG